jgi:HD superfamily phosphohydrolase
MCLFDWDEEKIHYIKRLLRISSLLHDLGHLPFSHLGEKDLCHKGYNHENYTKDIIQQSEEINYILEKKYFGKTIKINDIINCLFKTEEINPTYFFINELISGELGADRIDYLIRDSHHLGVHYGKFDFDRLIHTLTIIEHPDSKNPVLAIEEGGKYAAEGLILARYFMFLQVYFHDVRRIYDLHMTEYIKNILLPDGKFTTDIKEFLQWNDFKVLSLMQKDYYNGENNKRKEISKIFFERNHYRCVCEISGKEIEKNPDLFTLLKEAVIKKFGEENCIFDESTKATNNFKEAKFFVKKEDESIKLIFKESELIDKLKDIYLGRIYCKNNKELKKEMEKFCSNYKEEKLK